MMKANVILRLIIIMNKYCILLSATLVSFALASCQKEIEETIETNPVEEVQKSIPFEVNATIPSIETKTTLDPSTWEVSWEDGNVLYAVTTDAAWGSSTSDIAEFTYNAGMGKFSTESTIADGSHTFNFIYCDAGQKNYHLAAGTTHRLYASPSVDASAPTANLKNNDALVGQKTVTTPATIADIEMAHLYSLMKVTIKNKTTEDLTVTKFTLSIPSQNLAGVFTVTFGATPSVALSSLGSDEIEVNISNGAIANNGTLDIYFLIAPIDDYTGDVTFTVEDSDHYTYSKTNNITGTGISFTAGTYNTASFTMKAGNRHNPEIYERITTTDDFTAADYIVVGEQTSTSWGYLQYMTPDGSGRLKYTKSFNGSSELPATIYNPKDDIVWTVAKSELNYSFANGSNYLKQSSGKISFGASSPATFTASVTSNLFALATGSYYLSPNKDYNYWRCYGTGSITQSTCLALYKKTVVRALTDITLNTTGCKTAFYTGEAFDSEGLVVTASYSNASDRDVTASATITPPDMSTSGVKSVTVSYTENKVTVNKTYDITITTLPTFTVTLGDTSEPVVTLTEASPGAGVDLPSRSNVGSYAFQGWVTTNITSETSTAPASIIPAGEYHPSSNITLYPVYKKTVEETGSPVYTVTTTFTTGKQYVFGAVLSTENLNNANLSIGAIGFTSDYSSTSWGQYTSYTPNAQGKITASVADACVWTLESVSSGNYAFKKGTKYVYLANSTGKNTAGLNTTAQCYMTNTNSSCANSFTLNPVSESTMQVAVNTTSGGYRVYAAREHGTSNIYTYIRFYEKSIPTVDVDYYWSTPSL